MRRTTTILWCTLPYTIVVYFFRFYSLLQESLIQNSCDVTENEIVFCFAVPRFIYFHLKVYSSYGIVYFDDAKNTTHIYREEESSINVYQIFLFIQLVIQLVYDVVVVCRSFLCV